MASFNLPNRPPNPGSFNRVPPPPRPPVLAPGWTEHKAPTGHSYYYNAATKTSTYTRPVAPTPTPAPFIASTASGPYPSFAPPYGQYGGGFSPQQFPNQQLLPQQRLGYGQDRGRGGTGGGGRFNNQNSRHKKREEKPDRPKSKRAIPGATPWVLVTTKLGRVFAHNPETKVSLWKAPEDVQTAIGTMLPEDETTKEPRVRKIKDVAGVGKKDIKDGGELEPRGTKRPALAVLETKGKEGIENPEIEGEEDEEEEEEEEWEEDDEGEGEGEDGHENKRLKTEETGPSRPVEFTEDDIAWQLEAMAEQYGLEEDEEEEIGDMTEEDNINLFKEMLDDYKINPYSTWDAEMPRIVEDTRYVLLRTTKHRKDIFSVWCKDRIAELRAEKAKQKKLDPRVPFWAFLKENASPKLYWPEFKRKFKKVPEMKETKLIDKEKEKMYRDYISHIKISESIRENDLKKLLKSTSGLCLSTSLDDLPESVLVDVRYVTAPEKIRDAIIKDYLATLPDAPINEEEGKGREEMERKERALRDREATIRKEQWRLRGEEQRAKDMLREEVALIERAKIVSKKGLLGHIIKKEEENQEKVEMLKLEDEGKSRSS